MDTIDRVFLDRAYELAERGIGNTSPNPPVGAVLVRDGVILGEGYHHRAGSPHAETEALHAADKNAAGATLYVSLEPCNHQGRTPPCAPQIAAAGIARVVAGTSDPDPRTDGTGVQLLQRQGIAVEMLDENRARALIEPFARSIRTSRPYVSLKMAMSLDGFIASSRGVSQWLTGDRAREFVRELRIAHDAVAVGAGTVRIDNPQLTVRPPHHRAVPYRRVVFCETDAVDPKSAVFAEVKGYGKTIVLAPKGKAKSLSALQSVADVVFAGSVDRAELDLDAALQALRERGIFSLLCEGGPTVAAYLIRRKLVDRFYWLVAPAVMRSEASVPALPRDLPKMHFDRMELLEPDAALSGTFEYDV